MRRWICAALLLAAICMPGRCLAAPAAFDFRLTKTEAYWVSEVWFEQELVCQVAFSTGDAVSAAAGAPPYRTVVTPEFANGLFCLRIR